MAERLRLKVNAMSPKAGDLGSPDKPIVIEFVPSVDVSLITRGGTAMADCLGKMTGLTYKVEAGTSEAASIEAIGGGNQEFCRGHRGRVSACWFSTVSSG